MTKSEFAYFSTLIQDRCGIRMPPAKKTMLESRLRKRLRQLGLHSFSKYIDYIKAPGGGSSELVFMIDEVTTNKTDFFREPDHFQYLIHEAVPALLNEYNAGDVRKLKIWSAGCSTGEEPYSLAMMLSDCRLNGKILDFGILGTDISTKVLEKAKRAVYAEEKVDTVPDVMKRRYLLRSRDRERRQVRIVPELRRKVRYGRLNFLDPDYGINEKFDVIFFRNVLIYFDRDDQAAILFKLLDHLVPAGYLFTGHSETLHSLDLPLRHLMPSVYKKIN